VTAEVAGRRPPIEVAGPAPEVKERFDGRRVEIDDRMLERLRAYTEIDAAPDALVDAGRDWWPISLHWALDNEIGARPAVVARPKSTEEVVALLKLCNEARIPVTAAGGRSGVTGAAIPIAGGVALDMRGIEGIVEVDDASGLVTVRAGMYGPELESALRHDHGLTLGHWPQSMHLSTVGGWVACRAVGQYSTRYGKIEDLVSGLEVVLADGRVLRTGGLMGAGPRSSTGPDLTQLFLGSEGTLGVVTEAQLRCRPVPPEERKAAYTFETFADGLEAIRRTLRRGATPAVVRLHDASEAARSWGVEDGHLLITLDEGDHHIVDATMEILDEECLAMRGTPIGAKVVDRWLEKRNDVSELTDVTKLGVVADTIEVAASWRELPSLYDDVIAALQAVPGNVFASSHASHSYADGGCLYFTFAGIGEGDNSTEAREVFYRRSWGAVMDTTRAHHGSISHHHGIGLVRAAYLADALGEGFTIVRGLKELLDPHGILNPGKLGLPNPWDEKEEWPAAGR
jgi:alkyldihydroxyacetonephosphate synthase